MANLKRRNKLIIPMPYEKQNRVEIKERNKQ